jgi:hypothetical protein
MGTPSAIERRLDERIETNVQLTCRVPARPCRAIMHDLSRVGCRIEVTGAALELGATALIDLPGTQVAGRIVWLRGNVAGIQFDRSLSKAASIALGLEEPEPEKVVSGHAEMANIPSREGFLKHWMRRLTGRAV